MSEAPRVSSIVHVDFGGGYRGIPDPEPELPLQFGGGGGTSGFMETVDAKIAAAEARTDTKFTQVIGRLEALDAKLNGLNDKLGRIETDNQRTRSAVRTSAFALAALMVAISAFVLNGLFGAFNVGAKVSDVVHQEVTQAVAGQLALKESSALPPTKQNGGSKR